MAGNIGVIDVPQSTNDGTIPNNSPVSSCSSCSSAGSLSILLNENETNINQALVKRITITNKEITNMDSKNQPANSTNVVVRVARPRYKAIQKAHATPGPFGGNHPKRSQRKTTKGRNKKVATAVAKQRNKAVQITQETPGHFDDIHPKKSRRKIAKETSTNAHQSSPSVQKESMAPQRYKAKQIARASSK